MGLLIAGLAIFLGIHSVGIFAAGWREAQIAQHGERTWKGLYSIVSILGFALLVYGYGLARHAPVVLYTPPTFLRHIALLLMVPVFPLFLATYFPGRIKAALKHPQLMSIKLWATAHLLANGTLHDVILFGAFLVWAVLDLIAAKRRAVPRTLPGAPPSRANDAIAVVAGLVLYVAFVLVLHRWLIGVSPIG